MSTDLSPLAHPSSEPATHLPGVVGGIDPGVAASSPVPHVNGTALVKRRPTRAKAPKDSKVYKVVLAVIALRAQGVKAKVIAETLGYSEDVLRQYVSRAHRKGWINIGSFAEVDDQLEYILKHKIVENVHSALGERTQDGDLTAGAREMTLEAAKGLGMFKTHQVVKGEVATNVGVALRVEVAMPPAARESSHIAVRPGTIGGAAGLDIPIDADVVETMAPSEE